MNLFDARDRYQASYESLSENPSAETRRVYRSAQHAWKRAVYAYDNWEGLVGRVRSKNIRAKVAGVIWWDIAGDIRLYTFLDETARCSKDALVEALIQCGYPRFVAEERILARGRHGKSWRELRSTNG